MDTNDGTDQGADRLHAPRDLRAAPGLIADAEAELDRSLVDWRDRDRWSDAWLEPAQRWSEAVWERAVHLGPLPIAVANIAAGQRVAEAPVYICGPPRSGTTLLRDLLDGHPELAVLPSEGKFFEGFGHCDLAPAPDGLGRSAQKWLGLLANPNHQKPFWLLGRGHSANSRYVAFARSLLTWNRVLAELDYPFQLQPMVALALAHAMGQDLGALKRTVDKSPGYEFHLTAIWSRHPDAKVIQVVRDPAEVAASYVEGLKRNKLESAPVARMLRNVASSFVAARRATHFAPRGGFLLVRYEDLVGDRQSEMRRVASFLGVDWDDCLVRQTITGHDAEPNSSFHGLARRRFSPANAHERFWLAVATGCRAII